MVLGEEKVQTGLTSTMEALPAASWDGLRVWLREGDVSPEESRKEWWQHGTHFCAVGTERLVMKDLPRAVRRQRIMAEVFLCAFC